jgi:phospholipase/carboxylesterase
VTADSFGAPVVATIGSADPGAPLVVLLHGRGSHEKEILALADHLPVGPTYAAVRAPIVENGGYAWFANRGIGRPVAASLRATMDWFRGWLDEVAPPGRPVVLIGFSGGAAFAGGLVLDDPTRYAGAAILYGTLPFDVGLPTTPARLAGLPLVVAQGEHDTVIPRELLDRTWDYLLGPSGAPALARRDSVGHTIATPALETLSRWVRERLAFLAHRGARTPGPQTWSALPDGRLPERKGPRPSVSSTIPQEQRSDTAPNELQERLYTRIAALPGVTSRQSAISVPGARGFMLDPPRLGPDDAFLVPAVGEFAHLHPGYDGSLHVALPPVLASDLIAKGWGVAHPLAGVRLTPGMLMLFGPRDADELEVVTGVVAAGHAWATGRTA